MLCEEVNSNEYIDHHCGLIMPWKKRNQFHVYNKWCVFVWIRKIVSKSLFALVNFNNVLISFQIFINLSLSTLQLKIIKALYKKESFLSCEFNSKHWEKNKVILILISYIALIWLYMVRSKYWGGSIINITRYWTPCSFPF